MNNLYIEKTDSTPLINFDAQSGILKIEGRSLPENPYEFFMPIRDWLLAYQKKPAVKTIMLVNIPYYNTSSSKFLLTFFKIIEQIYLNGHDAEVRWIINNEEDLDDINIFKEFLSLPFKTVKNDMH